MLNSIGKTCKLCVYYTNINGFLCKMDSLSIIIDNISPDVLVISELKTKSISVVKNFFEKLVYSTAVCIESGVMIAAKKKHKLVNVTVSDHSNIISARIIAGNTPFRIISSYGLQETRPAEERAHFFDELSVEVEAAMMYPENLLLVGDLNAKIENQNGVITSVTPNGKLLLDILNRHSLQVMNFHPTCKGK